jgi:hypothetical protein
MPRLAGVARVVALATVAALTGCASLRTTAPTTARLDGSWQLDSALSDDAGARIQQFVATQEQKMRAQRARSPGGDEGADETDSGPDNPGPNGGGSGGSGGGRGRGGGGAGGAGAGADAAGGRGAGLSVMNAYAIKELRSQLQLSLVPPHMLGIERRGETVSLGADGLPPRVYRPGEVFSRIDEIGTARVDNGWDGTAFVLRTRYSSGVERTERFELDSAGHLVSTRTVNEPRIGKIAVRSVYERR